MDPISAALEMGRALLLTAGLAKAETGETVYFAGGKEDGPVIVLVHGVNDQAGSWAAVAKKLAKDYRLIIPDLPGHGSSGPQEGPIGLPMIVESLHEVIEKEQATKVTMVGNSMGGWVSMMYLLDHPDRVERLVIESGGGLAITPGVNLTATNREEAVTVLRAVHGPEAVITDASIDAMLKLSKESPFLRVLASNVIPHFLDHRIGEIDVPTTILWGEHDGVVLRPYVDKLEAGIPGATVRIIKGAGHIPHAQQPARFLEGLKEALKLNASPAIH